MHQHQRQQIKDYILLRASSCYTKMVVANHSHPAQKVMFDLDLVLFGLYMH